jgi:nicotinate-nucleotide pyrophosphorylase (carboxylating)
MNLNNYLYKSAIINALTEDIGRGDITTESTVPLDKNAEASLIAKQHGIIAGLSVARDIFHLLDEKIEFNPLVNDGDYIEKGTIVASIKGKASPILTAERTALNFLQRMSAIATRTAKCVEIIKGTKTKILDTRKTAPGLRMFDKYAVKAGGGYNHRFNLTDGVLIKDNHIVAAGGITKALRSAIEKTSNMLKIEVEVEDELQLEEAIVAGADIVLLDNMSKDKIRSCVQISAGRVLLEASGNMNEDRIKQVAEAGVDFISIGALTHSVKAFDLSLRFKKIS